MALLLVAIGDYDRLGNRRLAFIYRDHRIVVRHPPGQRDLDDYHPEDYRVRGRQQRSGTIAWALRGETEIGTVTLDMSREGTWFTALPFGGLGPSSKFLGKAIDSLLDEVARWQTHPDPAEAATLHQLREAVLSDPPSGTPDRIDVVPKWRRGRE